jgi:hypothetical protein
MRAFLLTHLSDQELLGNLARLVVQHRATTAAMLAHIAEVDVRRLYAPAGYPSMHWYCVRELKLSDDAAFKRIHAARVARKFPAILEALEEGRLNLTGVCLLAPYLRAYNAGDLIAAAMHKRKTEIEELLAARYPRSEVLALVQGVPSPLGGITTAPLDDGRASNSGNEHAPAHVATSWPKQLLGGAHGAKTSSAQANGRDEPEDLAQSGDGGRKSAEVAHPMEHAPAHVESTCLSRLSPAPVVDQRSFVKPHAAGRYTLHLNLSRETYEMLRYVQELLSHQMPSADIAEAIELALEALIARLEKRKFAATSRPRGDTSRAPTGSRHIPSHVMRAVWKRDSGQCTFVGSNGQRCPSRSFLEFDHIEPFARGGHATVDGIRLRCRTHNQYGAEQAFGAEFMKRKRRAAKDATE